MLEPSLKTAFNHSHHPLNDSNLDNTTSYKMINRAIYWTSKVDSSLNWSLIQVRPLTSKKMKNKTFFNVGTTHKCSFSWFHYLYNLFSDNTGFFIFGARQSCPLGNVSLGQTQIASMYKASRNKALTLGKQQWITHLSIAVEFPIHPKVKRLIS